MIYLLHYKGERRWNVTTDQVVRAGSEAEARRTACGSGDESPTDPDLWTCVRIDEDGPSDIILTSWTGDAG